MQYALIIAYSSIEQFEKIAKLDENGVNNVEIESFLMRFKQQLQSTLKKLIRLCMNKPADEKLIGTYKKLYGMTLQPPQKTEDFVIFSQHLKFILEEIKKSSFTRR